jgi:hypothetical protein
LVLLAVSEVDATPGMIGCLGLLILSYAFYGLTLIAFPTKRRILLTNLYAVWNLTATRSHQT